MEKKGKDRNGGKVKREKIKLEEEVKQKEEKVSEEVILKNKTKLSDSL